MVHVTTIQFCLHRAKTAMDNTWANEHGCVPVKLYLQKQVAGRNWPMSHSLPVLNQVKKFLSRFYPSLVRLEFIFLLWLRCLSVVWGFPPPHPTHPCSLQSTASLWSWWYWPSFYDLSLFVKDPTSPQVWNPDVNHPHLVGLLSVLLALPHEELKLSPFVLAGSQVFCN